VLQVIALFTAVSLAQIFLAAVLLEPRQTLQLVMLAASIPDRHVMLELRQPLTVGPAMDNSNSKKFDE
jgi:hypothetical protein